MSRASRAAAAAVAAVLALGLAGATSSKKVLGEATTAAVGNPRIGRAFVLSGADGSPVLELSPPAADERDGILFGHAVAGPGDVDGDTIPDLAVGAPRSLDAGGLTAGRVYLFSGADGSLIRAIDPPNAVQGMRYGFSLAAAGDLDADGRGDLLVGAPKARDPGGSSLMSAPRTGAAFVHSGGSGAVLARLTSGAPQKGAFFGWSVAAGIDLDGDGLGEMLVGAPGENVKLLPRQVRRANQGRAYLIDTGPCLALDPNVPCTTDPNDPWLREVDDPARQSDALFGWSVAFTGDASSDGFADLVVGAEGHSILPGDFAGRVFVMAGDPNSAPDPNNGVLVDRFAPVAQAGANFGFAVAGFPDVNGDGYADFAATAPETSTTADLDGAAFVIGGDPNSLAIATLQDPDPHRLAFFGGSISGLPDLTTDGLAEVVVGAELHRDPNGIRAGRAYVYEAASGGLHLTLESPTHDACARFGWTVAPAGDVTGDGIEDIIVGAPYHRKATRAVATACF